MMYLLLGDTGDVCCVGVKRALSMRGLDCRVVPHPFSEPVRLAWWLDTWSSASRFVLDDGTCIEGRDLQGVLVRGEGWLAPDGWRQTDLDYVTAEVRAALLGWLWSLTCTVVNRYPPWIWFRPAAPLLAWQSAIRRCGLMPLEMLVTNDPAAMQGFAGWPAEPLMYAPLSVDAQFVVTAQDTRGLGTLQRHVPVALAGVPQSTRAACVVGERVVWDQSPATEYCQLEPGLRRLVDDSGLSFVEIRVVDTRAGLRVAGVEPYPRLDTFDESAMRAVVDELTDLLVAT